MEPTIEHSRSLDEVYAYYVEGRDHDYGPQTMIQFLDLVAYAMRSSDLIYEARYGRLTLRRSPLQSPKTASVIVHADGESVGLKYEIRWSESPLREEWRVEGVFCRVAQSRSPFLEMLARLMAATG